jgi:hypothetical protein
MRIAIDHAGIVCPVAAAGYPLGITVLCKKCRNGETDMYIRLCMLNEAAEAGHIISLLEMQGLHPFTVCPPVPESMDVAIQRYSIELSEDEIEKGQNILALAASKEVKGLAK